MTVARVRMACLGGEEVSALGFGCASLGSRVAPAVGIAALERAFDAGVTWFDVAPAYGDGLAEDLLGRFARGRRHDVQILTKVGLAPPTPSTTQRMVRPLMRLALAAAPTLRTAIRRRRPANVRLPLDAASIASSLDASLRRLGSTYVDVLALHSTTPDECVRHDVIAALETAVASGKARAVAIASDAEAAAAGLAASPLYGVAQLANNPLDPGLAVLRDRVAARGFDAVTHGVYGNEGQIAVLASRIAAEPALAAAYAAAGYVGEPATIAADFLADFAFSANPDGIVLLSMFKPRHLAANVARHARPRDATVIARLAGLVA